MNEHTLRIAEALYSKKIAFSIYRFPSEKNFRLALDGDFSPHPQKKELWIAPFSTFSQAEKISLSVLDEPYLTEAFREQVETMPRQRWENPPELPEETSREEYFDRLEAFLQEMENGAVQKAILSRVFHLPIPDGFEPFRCFCQLAENYPNTFVHLSLHPHFGVWMGATPELLLEKEGADISIMALAGTQARRSEGAYSWAAKEMEEHLMVGRHIEAVAENFGCGMRSKEGPITIESGRVAHLRTDYRFGEGANFVLTDFLNELHPTPAVGGLPASEGLACILKHEGYDRRYYCGFIGETDGSSECRLFINLRCMQIGEKAIAVFVGGGITIDSIPESEWQETVLKSKTMTDMIQKRTEK